MKGKQMKKKEFNRLRAIDEAIVDGLQAQLRELDERVAGLVLNARTDARTIAGLRRRIKEKDATIKSVREAYHEVDGWLRTENSLKKKAISEAENARAFARVEAERARAFVRNYEAERNTILDRAVDAETKLDAAKVEVENKKAWYDMKLVGEVELRKQLERRIAELEGRT